MWSMGSGCGSGFADIRESRVVFRTEELLPMKEAVSTRQKEKSKKFSRKSRKATKYIIVKNESE